MKPFDLFIKNFPAELNEDLREQAFRERIPKKELIIRLLSREGEMNCEGCGNLCRTSDLRVAGYPRRGLPTKGEDMILCPQCHGKIQDLAWSQEIEEDREADEALK